MFEPFLQLLQLRGKKYFLFIFYLVGLLDLMFVMSKWIMFLTLLIFVLYLKCCLDTWQYATHCRPTPDPAPARPRKPSWRSGWSVSWRPHLGLSTPRSTVLHSHWSSSRGSALIGHILLPAILCHKEPDPTGLFACYSLVLCGIRIVGFHARKGCPNVIKNSEEQSEPLGGGYGCPSWFFMTQDCWRQ